MAWTQDDIDALKAAIATGTKSVSYSGPPARTVVYQDTDAMLRALAQMQSEVSTDSGTRRSVRYPVIDKGF